MAIEYFTTLRGFINRLEKLCGNNLIMAKSPQLGEQEPTDKVESKFEIGDWLINRHGNIRQVIDIKDGLYYCIRLECCDTKDTPWSGAFEYVDGNWHKWTIQDAKDGDVLACESGWTCIFKTLVNDETYSSYCFMDNTKWFYETGSECHTLKDEFVKAYNGEIHPATKEQRDTLEKAMADAGYTFDFEKKELKKIEQKPVFEMKTPEESLGIDSDTYNKIVDECVYGEQKPAWSDEDEMFVHGLIRGLKAKRDIHGHTTFSSDCIDITETIDWLKSLKDRVLLYPVSVEYNEEDIDNIADTFIPEPVWNALEESEGEGSNAAAYDYSQMIAMFKAGVHWLKFLKERYTWKPSDEHYELEEFAKIVRSNLTGISKAVQELFEARYLQLTGNKMYRGFKD